MENKQRHFNEWKLCLILLILTRIPVIAATYWSYEAGGRTEPREGGAVLHGAAGEKYYLLRPWRRWDALWFLSVARDGYEYKPGRQCNLTVFPVYPLAMKVVGLLTRNLLLAGLIVSNVCLYFLLVFLFRLAAGAIGEKGAVWALLFLLFFPTSFLLSSVYSESMFLLFTVLSFYYASREKWFLSAAAGLLACAARLSGVALVPALLFEYFRQKEFRVRSCRADALFLLLVPAGTLLYFAYLYSLTGSFTAYFETQKYWGHGLTFPLFSIIYEITGPRNFYTWLDFWTAIGFSVLSLMVAVKIGWSQAIYSLIAVLTAMSATKLYGMPRYALAAFPVFTLLGDTARKWWAPAALAAMALLQFKCIYDFINWKQSF